MHDEVQPFPVRDRQCRYEVLIAPADMWLTCETEEDARAVAAAPVLEYASLHGHGTGDEFAAELERTADALDKYRMQFGSRFFRRRAEEARRQV